jgi:hypothetical protein
MSFQQTLQGTYDKITGQASYATAYKIQAVVIADNRRFVAMRVNSYDILESYTTSFAATRLINLNFDLVTLRDYILPNIDSLYVEVKITKRSIDNNKDVGVTTSFKYQAFAVNPPKMEMNVEDSPTGIKSREQLNGFLAVDFQLVEPTAMYLKLCEYSGVYENITPTNFLKFAFNKSLLEATKANEPNVTPKLDIYTANNTTATTFILESRTRLMQLPAFVQNNAGMYTTGIGRYYKDNTIYIYPLYNTEKYLKTTRRLNVVSMPNNGRPSPNMTYILNGDTVSIITSGEVKVDNKSEQVARNRGTGVRYTRSSSLIDGMSSGKNNKAGANYDKTNVAKSIETKADGLSNAPKTVLTDNPYKALSELSEGLGFSIGLTWPNSKHSLIYPSMPVKFSFNENAKIVDYYGCVTGMRTTFTSTTAGFSDTTMVSNSTLTLFVKK